MFPYCPMALAVPQAQGVLLENGGIFTNSAYTRTSGPKDCIQDARNTSGGDNPGVGVEE